MRKHWRSLASSVSVGPRVNQLDRQKSGKDAGAYKFLLRAFFLWPERDDLILIDYDVFKSALNVGNELATSIANFQRYEWLPVKDRDFRVSFERVGLNGVMIKCENYYRNLNTGKR